jgi:hypothetical protein
MARLVVKGVGDGGQVIELHLGLNRVGRSSDNHFQLEHSTVSATHCEVVLSDQGVVVRDCNSTNGTFVNGERIQESKLSVGQVLRLGDVELLVETTDVTISIPVYDMPRPAPPVVLSDGSLICPRHPKARATHQCTHCREVLCDTCIHWLRRRGGKLMKFCPLCSHPCVPLGAEKKKRKSILGLWHKTVKLPFLHGSGSEDKD